jgi:hypothetical protein
MSETTACNNCNCCDARLTCLEKRVRWIRTGLLIALGVLILLIGIHIGRGPGGGPVRGPMGAMKMRRAHAMMGPGAGMPGPGPMAGPMRGGPDRGPDGPRDGGPRRDGKGGPGRSDRD